MANGKATKKKQIKKPKPKGKPSPSKESRYKPTDEGDNY